MRGLGLLIYTILFTFIFFIDQSAFLDMAGAMQGLPAQVEYVITKIVGEILYSTTMTVPSGIDLFVSECIVPGDENLDFDDLALVSSSCEVANGVVCIFYDYFGYRYRACDGILYTPTKNFYDGDRGGRIYSVKLDIDAGTVELTKQGVTD